MKFKIKKEVDDTGIWYWTVPVNLFLKIWFCYMWIIPCEMIGRRTACDCFLSKKEAMQHIKYYNSGYYKKKYYLKYI